MSTVPRTDPVALSNKDAERLRNACLALFSLADELAIYGVTVYVHKVSQPSAFECFPQGEEHLTDLPYRTYGTWQSKHGGHDVVVFTGDIPKGDA